MQINGNHVELTRAEAELVTLVSVATNRLMDFVGNLEFVNNVSSFYASNEELDQLLELRQYLPELQGE